MSPQGLIDKYYPEANELRHILLTHSRSVADKALWIADRHPELSLDRDFLYEAAMLHDIGIFLTDADGNIALATNPISVMAIWERTWCVRKDIRVMPWFVKGIRGPVSHWRILLRKICLFLTGTCFR